MTPADERREIYCGNCGKKGHIYKKCNLPIMSMGLICLRIPGNINLHIEIQKIKHEDYSSRLYITPEQFHQTQILLIRRRNTFSFIEFIRGKYDLHNICYLQNLFNLMTEEEKQWIVSRSFDDLWSILWCQDIAQQIRTRTLDIELTQSRNKFQQLKTGCEVLWKGVPYAISIDILIQNCTYHYDQPEWGFPKGRRNYMEKDIACAKREFYEETNFTDDYYQMLPIEPFYESYLASNSIKYKHTYYVSQEIQPMIPCIHQSNRIQQYEISDIQWFNFHDALHHLREYNLEKRNIIINLQQFLRSIVIRTDIRYHRIYLPTVPDGEEYEVILGDEGGAT